MKDDVLIKSNKYGITIYFNSDNSFEELLDDVKNKFQSAAKFFNHAKMAVEYEGRSFTEDEERQLTREIESAANIEYFVSLRKILLQNKSIKNYWTKALKLSMKGTDSSIKVH